LASGKFSFKAWCKKEQVFMVLYHTLDLSLPITLFIERCWFFVFIFIFIPENIF
jgi:hypothetical protein